MGRMNPIIDTGFADALSRGMGLGLQARQLQQANLYRNDQMARNQMALEDRLARTEIMRDRADEAAVAAQLKLDDRSSQRKALAGVGERLYGDLNPDQPEDFVPFEGPQPAEANLYTPEHEQAKGAFAGDFADLPAPDRMALQREATEARKLKVREKDQRAYESFIATDRAAFPGGPEAWDAEHDRRYIAANGTSATALQHRLEADRNKGQSFFTEAEALAQEFPQHANQLYAIAENGQSPRGLAGQLRAQANRKRLPTPEEAEARIRPYIDGLTSRMGHAPDALTIATIRDRVERGERVSGDDLLSAGVDERYVHAGLEAAQKEEATAAEKRYNEISRAYAQALKAAGGDAAKLAGTEAGANLIAEKTGALGRWARAKADLMDLQRGRKTGGDAQPPMSAPVQAPTPQPAAPAPAPMAPPAADPVQALKAQLPDPIPGETREQYKARVKAMMQQPPATPAGVR